MAKKIRWGIVGTGQIAHLFAQGLSALKDTEIAAVSSRTEESAEKFAAEFGVPNRHIGSVALAGDKDVDVVYIATPHPMHKDDTINCLKGGKAVLCEKPFAMNSAEAMQMIMCARKKNLFLMEAMWMYFFPAMAKIRQLSADGAIGEVRLVQANFCIRCEWNPKSRLLNPQLGGGALLDVGVYDIAFARMIYGKEPGRISSMAHIGKTGVDEQGSMIFGYEGGAMAVLTCAVQTETLFEAAIYGTDGYIKIPHMFFQPDRIIVKAGQEQEKEIKFKRLGNGYSYEAAEVMRCLRDGEVECPIMPLDVSIAIMKTMDQVRQQWGLVYPMETV
ncbi:MAG: Gfo/Idh/MocA family oxidoreductase [Sedimentisphaerales bacterium]|nr:Gfo/Idh/MocA family oxidoreductase [Sedimentisphaerales bacterium]